MQRLAVHDEDLGTTYRMPPARRRGLDFGTRRLMLVGGFLTCLVVLGVSLYSALNRNHSGPPPLIQASKDPIRVRPQNPGGMQVLGQNDDILGADTADQASRLAPPPEAPALQALRARQQAALSTSTVPPSPPTMSMPTMSMPTMSMPTMSMPTMSMPTTSTSAISAPRDAQPAAVDVPKVSLPVSMAPHEASVPAVGWRKEPGFEEAHAAEPAPPPPVTRRPALQQLASRDAGAAAAVAPPQAAPVAPAPAVFAAVAPVVSAPVAQPSQRSQTAMAASSAPPSAPVRAAGPISLTPIVAANGKGALAQLASVPSEAAAQAEWQRLNRVLGGLVQNHSPLVTQVTYKGNPVWRLRVGGFASKADAAAFCGKVKAKGFSCLVPRS